MLPIRSAHGSCREDESQRRGRLAKAVMLALGSCMLQSEFEQYFPFNRGISVARIALLAMQLHDEQA